MQQDWQPEAEHGAMYSVVGPNYTIDNEHQVGHRPLVAQGGPGVKVEVRSGGPNTGFKPIPRSCTPTTRSPFGAVNTDDAIVQACEACRRWPSPRR